MELAVCYYPEHWDEKQWPIDAQNMKKVGIKKVRIGEFSWSKIETKEGLFDWQWLDRAIDILGKAGLEVILGTPTTTPPKWLVDKIPDMLAVDIEGRLRHFGSRRHYSFSSVAYREECKRITTLMAKRYGQNPYVTAWQTDNEYGCHDTIYDYSVNAQKAFRLWLKAQYLNIETLNRAWGNVFWSMIYNHFDEIDLPNLTVTEANPAHQMAFRRFSSDQVCLFNKAQVDILRMYSPQRDIIHNFMGNFLDFDHFKVAEDLDVSSWDHYPIGFLDRDVEDEKHRKMFMRVGDPEIGAFHHDLYRATGKGRMWVMELQPGPVNWAPYNPIPADGAVRLWGWEAIAHGAEVVSYFRWRQAPWGQEQMHAALRLPNDQPDQAYGEIAQLYQELALLPKDLPNKKADVALLFDYEAAWMIDIQPQAEAMDYSSICLDIYREIRSFNLNVDIVPQGASLDGYKAVIIPPTPYVKKETLSELKKFDGHVLAFCRTGSREKDFCFPADLPPGDLSSLLGIRVKRVDTVRPYMAGEVSWQEYQGQFQWKLWREIIDVAENTEVISYFSDTQTPAVVDCHRYTYVACLGERPLLKHVIEHTLKKAGLPMEKLPDGLRIRYRGDYGFAFNYGLEAAHVPMNEHSEIIVGEQHLEPTQVAIWKRKT